MLLNTEANHMRVDGYGTIDIQPKQYLDCYQKSSLYHLHPYNTHILPLHAFSRSSAGTKIPPLKHGLLLTTT